MQLWQFAGEKSLSIGRSDERDVCIPDPYVSRHHADLCVREGGWWLVSLGRNGVLLNGRDVAEAQLSDGATIRLGGRGPILKFHNSPVAEHEHTLSGADDASDFLLQLNAKKRDKEVTEIVESDFFQQLRDKANEMRKQRDTQSPGEQTQTDIKPERE